MLLLMPKIRPPRVMSKLVVRERLGEYVRAIEDARLAVICAPSGFGKTTIGAVWARELKNRSALVGWLSLDKDDNEQPRFFNYLFNAIQYALHENSAQPTSSPGMIQPAPLKGDRLLLNLINNIAEEGSEFFLFLDDFHVVTDALVRESIQFLIRNAPANFHLVVLSHPHGVSDFKSGKPGTEFHLNAGDLRFTEAETGELFNTYNRKNEQAAAAYSMTGGWAAALRILAASNIGSGAPHEDKNTYLLTENYLGNLLDVVLGGLTQDEVKFIEATCITGRMCAPLFTALTGICQPGSVIHSVENTHCLVSRISEDGHWFGCHDLIRDSVLARLSQSNPALLIDVANCTSRWYAEQGYWSEAVAQALAVDNRELALQTIEACATKLFYRGDLLTLIGWENRLKLSSLPSTKVKTLTVLCMALSMAADREHDTNLRNLIELTDARMRRELPPDTIVSVHWHLHSIRSVLASSNDDLAVALELAEECLAQPVILPSIAETVRCVAAYSYLQFRQWDEFYKVLTEVSREADDEFTFLAGLYRQILLGLAAITQLNFNRGIRYLEEASRLAHEKHGATSLPAALANGSLAFIHCERLELHKAENLLAGTLDLVAQSSFIDCIARTYTAAFRIALLRHEEEYALGLLEKWERIVTGSDRIRLQLLCAYEKMCFFLREKNLARASASLAHIQHLHGLAESGGKSPPAELTNYVWLAKGQYALASHRFPEAIDHVNVAYKNAVRDADSYMIVLCTAALAIAEFKTGKSDAAFEYIGEALALAHASGLRVSLLCQPTDIWPLLEMYKRHIVRRPAFLVHNAVVDELSDARNRNFNALTVNLSSREENVLRLLAQDKSNKEISAALQIAPDTVKTHIKNIFIKLNVTKRNAAARRAIAMNLL